MGIFSKLFGKKQEVATTYLTEEEMTGITDHFDRYVGKSESVFHEIVSDEVHIDVHVIPETADGRYMALFTTGMSALPMPGKGADDAYAEVFVILPKDWPLQELSDEKNFWPVRMLKQFARVPTHMGVAIFDGLSMPNGDPAEDFPGTYFQGIMLTKPTMFDRDFGKMRIGGKTRNFFLLVPLTLGEMNWKVEQQSATALTEKFAEMGIDPWRYAAVDPHRGSLI